MTEKLRELYEKLYQGESANDLKKFIWVVENNIEFIETLDKNEKDDYINITKILTDYGIALFNAGYFSKTVHYLDKSICLIEDFSELKNKDLLEEPLYEVSVFHRGLANHYLKKYKEAIPDFKKLSHKFPDNDKYRNWCNSSIDNSLKNIEWGFFSVLIITSIALLTLKPIDRIVNNLLFCVLLTSLIVSISISVYKKRRKIA